MMRTKKLAAVHIARKDMGLDEDTYRDILKRVTGKASAGDCSDAQLAQVLSEFEKLGWQGRRGGRGTARRPLHPNPQVRMAYAIWGDIKKLLEGTAGDAELRSFVRRQTKSQAHPDGVDAPEFCAQADLLRVIEGLKGWRTRLQRSAAA